MDHVVIFVKGVAENPEIVLVRQPIEDADLFPVHPSTGVQIDDHIGASEVDPLPVDLSRLELASLKIFVDDLGFGLHLYQDVDRGWPRATARVKDTFALFIQLSLQHELEKARLDARRYHIVRESG